MSDKDKKEAREHAERAARQVRHAARNTGEAAEAAAEHVKDEVVDGASAGYNTVKTMATSETALRVGIAAVFLVAGVVNVRKGLVDLREAKRLRRAEVG